MYSTPPSDYILLPVDSHVGGRLFFYIYLTNISLKNTKPPTEMRPQRAARGGRSDVNAESGKQLLARDDRGHPLLERGIPALVGLGVAPLREATPEVRATLGHGLGEQLHDGVGRAHQAHRDPDDAIGELVLQVLLHVGFLRQRCGLLTW